MIRTGRLIYADDQFTKPLSENPEIGTKFKPECPFDMYTRGFVYVDNKDKRRTVTLYTPKNEVAKLQQIKLNMLASTYLYAVKLFKDKGILIPSGYHVDHIDNDSSNDTYVNFQLLTREENARKEGLRVGSIWCKLICPVCNKQWNAMFNRSPKYTARKDIIYYCSQECRLIFRSTLIPYSEFKDLRVWISEHQTYQRIRKWQNDSREEIIETYSEAMLNFDLAKASGRVVRYDSPRLLDDFIKKETAKRMRKEGKSWKEIGDYFNLGNGQTRLLFKDDTMTDGVGGRNQNKYKEIIRLYNEGMSIHELTKMFNYSNTTCINRVLRTQM